MKYLNFIEDKKVLAHIVGSPMEDIEQLEKELGLTIPEALKEYLLLMGRKPMDFEYYKHGTNDMKLIYERMHEWIDEYRNKGFELNEIKTILPFSKFQDTFWYVPIEKGNENPPVMAFDIGDTPEIRKLTENITDFVKWQYGNILSELYRPRW